MSPTSKLRVRQARYRVNLGLRVLGLSSKTPRGTWWLAGVQRSRVSKGERVYPKGQLWVVGRMRQLNTSLQAEYGIKVAGPALGPGCRGGAITLPPPHPQPQQLGNCSSEENPFPLPNSSPALSLLLAWPSPGNLN